MEGGQGTGGKGCSWTSKSRQRKTCLETTKKTQWRRGQESGKPISRYFVAFIFEDLKKENQIKLTSMSTYKKGKIFFVVLPLFVVVTQRKIFFFFQCKHSSVSVISNDSNTTGKVLLLNRLCNENISVKTDKRHTRKRKKINRTESMGTNTAVLLLRGLLEQEAFFSLSV